MCLSRLYLAVAVGSAVGAVARYLCSVAFLHFTVCGFPWDTLFVNMIGSLLIGFYATLTGPDGESDEYKGRPLYEAIVFKARELGLAGATVMRGAMGYGRSSRMHTAKILRLSDDLPLVVEVVDTEDKIEKLLEQAGPMLGSCLVTLEKARVVHYGHSEGLG